MPFSEQNVFSKKIFILNHKISIKTYTPYSSQNISVRFLQQDRTLHFCALFDLLLSLVLIYFLSASLSQTTQQMAESLSAQFSKI
jgi:hypothetical protein